jgi:hypothetical protein
MMIYRSGILIQKQVVTRAGLNVSAARLNRQNEVRESAMFFVCNLQSVSQAECRRFDPGLPLVHGGRFGTLLAESRKYGITLVLASQGMYQLAFAKDVFSNCPTQITFNVSGEDAQAIQENWNEEQVQATHITSLPRYEFHCRTFSDNVPVARRIKGWPNIEKRGDEANPTKLIKHSLQRYGSKTKDVIEKINRFLAA